MSGPAVVVRDEALRAYDFGPAHPLTPVRVELTFALADELGVLGADGVTVVGVDPATDHQLERVHTPAYLAAVRRAGGDARRADLAHGIGTPDVPAFPNMHEAAALVAGASLAAAEAVWAGRSLHAVNLAGGLHHAMPAAASGFCVYNDPAVAIAELLELGARKIAYVDVDVHHGDGVQAVFYDDPRVLTISLHESGRTLFPGTGFPAEVGGPDAEGGSVNVALPAGTGDAGWLRAFHAVVPPLVRAFGPDVLVSQSGCDSHALDPLANLMLSVDGQRTSYAALHELAHEVCAGRWVALGGGGYERVRVVPRAWTHLLAIAGGEPLDPGTQTPPEWRRLCLDRARESAPTLLTDGRNPTWTPWQDGAGDPANQVDQAIAGTRSAVFPWHGLDPAAAG
ncbi:MAG: acetoin utilization protein AcuC [Mycobacteriales bacterium]